MWSELVAKHSIPTLSSLRDVVSAYVVDGSSNASNRQVVVATPFIHEVVFVCVVRFIVIVVDLIG